MFEARLQSFDDSSERGESPARVAALRAELKRRGLDGFVVPRADRQQNEYLPASEERLSWLTGFTGSAGAAIALMDRAVVFVDGRYTVQAEAQVDGTLFAIEHLVEHPPEQWLEQNLNRGAKVGYDPWLHTSDQAERLKKACTAAGAELVAVDSNPIDALWRDRPPPPAGAVTLRDLKLAGESAADKFKRIRAEMARLRADVLLVSDPQNVAWTFNIRGADVAHTPLALAYALIPLDGRPALYVDGSKLNNNVRHSLEEFADVRSMDDLTRDLGRLEGTEILATEGDAPLIGLVDPCDQVEHGRLAGAVRTDEPENDLVLDGEAHLRRRAEAAEVLRHLVKNELHLTRPSRRERGHRSSASDRSRPSADAASQRARARQEALPASRP